MHIDDHALSILDLPSRETDLGVLTIDDPGQIARAAFGHCATDQKEVGRAKCPADLHSVGSGAGRQAQRALCCDTRRCFCQSLRGDGTQPRGSVYECRRELWRFAEPVADGLRFRSHLRGRDHVVSVEHAHQTDPCQDFRIAKPVARNRGEIGEA